MRACRNCGTWKDESEFPIQRKTGFRGDANTTTLRLDCKVCVAAAAKAYRQTHTSVSKPRLDPSIDKYLYSAIGCRLSDAKARGGVCSVSKDYLYALYLKQSGQCALSGRTLTTVKNTPDVLSLDQIDAGIGYVEGNVQWVAWAVNRAKGDLSMPDFIQMCHDVLGRCNDYPVREYSQVAGSAQHPVG